MGATEKNGPIVHPEPRVTIVTYIGHSTLHLEMNGVRLLTDLVLRDHVALYSDIACWCHQHGDTRQHHLAKVPREQRP